MLGLNDDDNVLPQELVGDWKPDEKFAVLKYLNSSKKIDHDPINGLQLQWFHKCKFACGEKLGSEKSHDSHWVWDSALSHYVEHHDVILPSKFVIHGMHSKEAPVVFG